jgi:tetratricopeptide (TPR) repeat protein
MATCEKALAGKGVRWVAVASGNAPPAEVKAAVAAAGVQMPVLLDQGDKLYERLQIRLHPVVAVVNGKGVLQGIEAFRQLDYVDVVTTRVRFALGEVDQAAVDRSVNPDASPLPGSDPSKKAMRDVNMARRLLELGQYEQAAKQAQKALEQAPVPAAFAVIGTAYAKLGRCPAAKPMLEQAQRLEPGNPDVAAARALCK